MTTFFDASTYSSSLLTNILTLAFISASIGLFLKIRIKGASWKSYGSRSQGMVAVTVLCIGLLIFQIVAELYSRETRLRYKEMVDNYDCKMIEGSVDEFRPAKIGPDDTESFAVQGVRFTYADSDNSYAFHKTSLRGGPIRAGLFVRLCYDPHSMNILKLQTQI